MNKAVLSLLLFLFSYCTAFAQLSQTEKIRLEETVKTNFLRNSAEGCQIYKTKSGYRVLVIIVKSASNSNKSSQEATILAQRLATEFIIGAENKSVSVYNMQVSETSANEFLSDKIVQSSLGQVKEMQDLEEFQDNDGTRVYVKYLVLSKTNANRGLAGVMSMVIPGTGQFYKGKTIKGGMFLGLTGAAAAGVAICESTRSSYVDKRNSNKNNANLFKQYNERVNNWQTYRNLCIGAAGAIYLWNVIDAFFSQSAQRSVVTSKSGKLSIAPTATQTGFGVGLAYHF